MAIITGVSGTVTIPEAELGFDVGSATAINATVFVWSATMSRDIFPADVFDGSSTAKLKIGGLHQLTGTLEGFMDKVLAFDFGTMTTADHPGSTADFVLNSDASDSYTFKGLISSVTMNVTKGAVATFTCAFRSVSAIT